MAMVATEALLLVVSSLLCQIQQQAAAADIALSTAILGQSLFTVIMLGLQNVMQLRPSGHVTQCDLIGIQACVSSRTSSANLVLVCS